jgi:hypothetical protein
MSRELDAIVETIAIAEVEMDRAEAGIARQVNYRTLIAV